VWTGTKGIRSVDALRTKIEPDSFAVASSDTSSTRTAGGSHAGANATAEWFAARRMCSCA